MKLAQGLQKHGFRKWYERELLHCHAHLLLTLLCAVGLFAAFEALGRFRSVGDQLTDLTAIAVCAGVGLWSLRRYLGLLMHAEASANQANCPQCKAYARFKFEHENAGDGSVRVRCKACQHRWTISQ